MSKIDLHIHSNVSADGELSPREISANCAELGMTLIAITDHNSVRGSRQLRNLARGFRMISGVELDCTFEGRNFHVLGYDIDLGGTEFDEIERDIQNQEREAAALKIRLFREFSGIPISESEILDAAKGGPVTGELIAEIAFARDDAAHYDVLRPYLPGGSRSDMPNVRFYWDFFSEGKPAYVPIRYISLTDAVSLIHDTGGAAVLAHPGQNLAGDDAPLEGIIAAGIDGIEAFSTYHDGTAATHYLETAQRNRLFVTCGSDFHGKHKPNIALGGHGAFWDDSRLMEEMCAFL